MFTRHHFETLRRFVPRIAICRSSNKWPTLSELYQKCFYPEYTMKILSGSSVENNLHNANIDACMAAKCFFKLTEMGYLKELRAKTTINILSDEHTNNYESLHRILDTWESDNLKWVYRKIEHLGLGVTRVVKDVYGEGYRDDFNTNVVSIRKR